MDLNKIIFCSDYDGTITGNLHKIGVALKKGIENVCDENEFAINEIVKGGGRFVVSSGRTPTYMQFLYDFLPIDDIFAGVNGTALYSHSKKEFIFRHPMLSSPQKTFEKLLNCAPKIKNVHITDYDANVKIWTPDKGDPILFAGQIDQALKFVIEEDDPSVMDEIEKSVRKSFSEQCEIFKSCPHLLELNEKGAGKGEIVNFFKKNDGSKTIIALGDYYNDTSMLLSADYAFCPENAVNEVKNACSRVFRSSGDGFLLDVLNYVKSL